ncbi:MAG: energy-coupling factor transporter ATPase [Ignavibacteriales bacterium]|nr:energy-coupling factor transporter ATPase [Ignavibacteriales bacterium]
MMKASLDRGSILVDIERYRYEDGISDTLSKLNFKVSKGEFVGLMGRTGAGKTTTLMLLNGLIPHFFDGVFDGEVISNTMNTARYRVQTLARFIGLVMQDPETQIFGITVEKDVAFGPSNLAYGKEKILELVGKSLKAVGLQGYENRLTTELSGGEKQRLTIAGVLAMEPEILILDEPTSELDPAGKVEIYKLLSDLRNDQHVTILISGHDSEEMLQYTDRILVLDNGSIVWEGKPENLFCNFELTGKFGIHSPEAAEIFYKLNNDKTFSNNSIVTNNKQFVEHFFEKYNFNFDQNKNIQKVKKDITVNSVIEARDISFSYKKGQLSLHKINVKINKGEFVALIGKNGAGKTTFSKHLNGLLRPDSGQILINGRDIKAISTAELSKEVGYVFQNPDHQIFAANIWEEIDYGLKNLFLTEDERNKRIHAALEFVGLEKFKDRHPFTLGKGERQKLAVATILAMEPGILVIDEPTTGQDWDGTKRMMEMLEKLHHRGHTILAITHNMRLAAEYADRVIVFSAGKIVLDGTPKEVFYQEEILNSVSITPPDSVLIGSKLRQFGLNGFPVTVNELQNELSASINGKVNVN